MHITRNSIICNTSSLFVHITPHYLYVLASQTDAIHLWNSMTKTKCRCHQQMTDHCICVCVCVCVCVCAHACLRVHAQINCKTAVGLWGCSSGGVYVPCTYSHARCVLPQANQVFVVVFVWRLSSANYFVQLRQNLNERCGQKLKARLWVCAESSWTVSVKVEVAVLGSPSTTVLVVSVDVTSN